MKVEKLSDNKVRITLTFEELEKRKISLSDIEKNIIWAHMFPIYVALPKYAESWVVTVTDKVVASYEFCLKFKNKLIKARG